MKNISFLFTLFILAFVFLGISYLVLSQPVNRNNSTEQVFLINPGEGLSTIGKHLESQGLIKNRYVFFFEVKRLGLDKKIQAGDFKLAQNMSLSQIANQLTFGTLDVWVRIQEGWRAEEVSQAFDGKIASYSPTWVNDFKMYEGHLFPDTYLLPKDATSTNIIQILTSTFDKKTAALKAQAQKNGISFTERLILASLIEREAAKDVDRPIVAGIFLNRLRMDMPLQVDATVQYAVGYQPSEKSWWKKHLTADDLQMNSPYNTYKNTGLPPKPICNPGIASLTAAINPAQTDYLYYLTGKDGQMHYAKTFEEHQANIAKYL